jgi:hypothetical protein
MKERLVHVDVMFITNHQSPEVSDPSDTAFHFPSTPVTPKLASILGWRLAAIGLVRTDQIDATPLEPLTQRIGIGRAIVDQPLGIFSGPPAATWYRDAPERRFDQRGFVRGRRGQLNSQRNTLAACHHHPLRTFSAFGFSNASPPFFAGAKLPSAKVSSQSRRPRSSNSPRKVRQISSQTPCSSQSRSRRQQVLGEGYCFGKSLQRAPERSTHRMPSKQGRCSTGFRPPALDRLILGSSGSILLHCSSVSSESCRDMKRTPFHAALKHKCFAGANLCASQF